jgi:hypothetical protein
MQERAYELVAGEFWAQVARGHSPDAPRDAKRLLSRLEPRLRWEPIHGEVSPDERHGVLGYLEHEARGVAERLAEHAPSDLYVSVGRPQSSWKAVCRQVAEETGIDISSARVRAGFTRGHLLEVVVGLPQASGDARLAAELSVEGLLGEAFVDDWVAAIDVAVVPRSGPLRVMQKSSADGMHPLVELCAIAERAVSAVDEQLPSAPRWARRVGADWTVLEMESTDVGPQPDRVLATTYEPELVKCALEGMPFHSRRFSKVGERFAWLGAPALGEGAARQARRQHVEDALDRGLRELGLGAVVGSGFGEKRDYLDLCLAAPASAGTFTDVARDPALGALMNLALQLGLGGAGVVLGFYDTRWSEARIEL